VRLYVCEPDGGPTTVLREPDEETRKAREACNREYLSGFHNIKEQSAVENDVWIMGGGLQVERAPWWTFSTAGKAGGIDLWVAILTLLPCTPNICTIRAGARSPKRSLRTSPPLSRGSGTHPGLEEMVSWITS
jgi:hypothetical protein